MKEATQFRISNQLTGFMDLGVNGGPSNPVGITRITRNQTTRVHEYRLVESAQEYMRRSILRLDPFQAR